MMLRRTTVVALLLAACAVAMLLATGCADANRMIGRGADFADAQSALRRGDRARAVRLFDEAIQRDNSDLATYVAAAQAALGVPGYADLALEYANAGLAVRGGTKENRALLHSVAGAAHQSRDEGPAALESHRAAYELVQDNMVLQNNLAYAYAEYSDRPVDLDTAEKLALKAVAQANHENAGDEVMGTFLDTLGWVYLRQSRTREAVLTLDEAAEAVPANADVWYHLGRAYLAAGRGPSAKSALLRAYKLDSKHAGAREWLSRLVPPVRVP